MTKGEEIASRPCRLSRVIDNAIKEAVEKERKRAEAVEKAARKVVAVKEDAFKAIFKAIDELESALALCEEKGKEKV